MNFRVTCYKYDPKLNEIHRPISQTGVVLLEVYTVHHMQPCISRQPVSLSKLCKAVGEVVLGSTVPVPEGEAIIIII